MSSGTVKWSSPDASFCIIAPDLGGENIFVAVNDVESFGEMPPDKGRWVVYRPTEDQETS